MSDGNRPKPQHAPKAPHENAEFLASTPARPIRIISEYIYPLVQLKKEGICDTIVMFGSARIHSHEAASSRYTRLKKMKTSRWSDSRRKAHRLHIREAKNALEMSVYYEEARLLSHKITTWALSLGPRPRRFVICSGGGPGIMEAANRGAYEAGGKSIGLSIELPHEQFANPYISPELSFNFHYFFMRKLWFAQIAKALIVFPGGFGTLDELFEILTLAQTQKLAKKILVVIYGSEYWKRLINFDAMIDAGTISASDLDLFHMADTPEQGFEFLRDGLSKYHLGAQQSKAAPEAVPEIAKTNP
jgi:uncharacterized protein (TIGR00730 family)